MTGHAAQGLRQRQFTGTVAPVALHVDDVEELYERGIDVVVHMYGGAGRALADQRMEACGEHGL